jgi:hypothetical protein
MSARYLAITKSNTLDRRYRTRTINRSFGTGPVTLGMIIVFLVAAISVVYLVQSNSIATSGYATKDLETQIEALQKQTLDLQLQVAEAKSLKNLQQNVENLHMVSAGTISYVAHNPSVAEAP